MMDATERMVYRRLIRAVRAACKFHKPAAANLYRALRLDVRHALAEVDSGCDPAYFTQHARNTLALLVSAAISPRTNASDTTHLAAVKLRDKTAQVLQDQQERGSSKASIPPTRQGHGWQDSAPLPSGGKLDHTLANGVLKNLASLVYHHLSPNTQMQPASTTAGGTNRVRLNVSRKSDATNDVALDIFGGGDADGMLNHMGNRSASPFSGEYEVPSLRVPPKPVRGPVGHRAQRWDGQNAKSILMMQQKQQQQEQGAELKGSSLAALNNRVLTLVEAYRTTRDTHGPTSTRTLQALSEMRQARGLLRSALKQAEREERRVRVVALPKMWMYDLVRNAERSEGVWLGGVRFGRWRRGEWLPP